MGTVYTFGALDTDGKGVGISPGIRLIRKEDAEKFGGYDEDFCGGYGYEDIFFRKVASAHGIGSTKLRDIKVVNHGTGSDVGDASVPFDKDPAKRKEIYDAKSPQNPSKDNLRFKWKKIH